MPTLNKVKYEKISAVLRAKTEKEGPLTVEDCKNLIGWTEEPEEEDWGNEFTLKDLYKKKIRLINNPTNRPFRKALADRYANEHLRKKWALNLETIVADKFGYVLQGQHRLIGLILGEQLRQLNPDKWGKIPLVYETLVGFGVDNSPTTANTYDLGAKRSLDDVIYRHESFGKKISDKEQRRISKTLAGAIRLVWLRMGGKQVSFAPHFPHSEALEFYRQHPAILESVKKIFELDTSEEYKGGGLISSLVSLGYASALHFLMVSKEGEEKASEFWRQFASGANLSKGSPILPLKNFLQKTEASSGGKRDELIGVIIKAWLLWAANKPGAPKDIKISKKKQGDKFILSEAPRIGGLDSIVKTKVELNLKQLLIVKALRSCKKEVGYKRLTELTGLTLGPLSREILEESKNGKTNSNSLCARKLVSANQYDLKEGEKGVAPFMFKLNK